MFKVNQTYATRSIGDSNCVFQYTVILRTAKFVTLEDEYGETVRVKVTPIGNGGEIAYPDGKYSMAHSINSLRDEVNPERTADYDIRLGDYVDIMGVPNYEGTRGTVQKILRHKIWVKTDNPYYPGGWLKPSQVQIAF